MLFNQEEKSFLVARLMECHFDETHIDGTRENSDTFSYMPTGPKDGENIDEFLQKFPRWEFVVKNTPNPRLFVQLALKKE